MKYLRYIFLLIFILFGACQYDVLIDSIQQSEENSNKTRNINDGGYSPYKDADLFILVPTHHIPVLKNMYHLSDSADINTIAYHNGVEDTFHIAQNDTIMIGESWWNVIYENRYKIQYNCFKDISLELTHDTIELIYLDLYNIPMRKNDTTYITTELVHEIKFDVTVESWGNEENINL